MRAPHRRQRGATLIEALVGLLILSMGALGYAALQVDGAAKNASALRRTKATQLAYEMSDRIRANQGGVAAGAYAKFTSSASAPSCAAAPPCKPVDMAALDFAHWLAGVERALPAGKGVVCLTSTPAAGTAVDPGCDGKGTDLAIKVFWTEKSSTFMFSTVVRP